MSTAPDSEAKVLTKEVAFLLVSCVALSAFFFLVESGGSFLVIFLHIKTGKGEVWELTPRRSRGSEDLHSRLHDETSSVSRQSSRKWRTPHLHSSCFDSKSHFTSFFSTFLWYDLSRYQEALLRLIEEKHVALHRYRLLEASSGFLFLLWWNNVKQMGCFDCKKYQQAAGLADGEQAENFLSQLVYLQQENEKQSTDLVYYKVLDSFIFFFSSFLFFFSLWCSTSVNFFFHLETPQNTVIMLKSAAIQHEDQYQRNMADIIAQHNDQLQAMISRAEETERIFIVGASISTCLFSTPRGTYFSCCSKKLFIGIPKADPKGFIRAVEAEGRKRHPQVKDEHHGS